MKSHISSAYNNYTDHTTNTVAANTTACLSEANTVVSQCSWPWCLEF